MGPNKDTILYQFDLVEKSLTRAKLPFETDMMHPNVLKVTEYEITKSILQLQNILDEMKRGEVKELPSRDLYMKQLLKKY